MTPNDLFKTTDEFITAVIERAESKEYQEAKKRLYKPVSDQFITPTGQRQKFKQK